MQEKTKTAPVQKSRMVNLELLRCIAMMMVVVLHFLGKGNLLGDLANPSMTATGTVAWLLESFAIVAVNVYMLISGYFLCESSFKISRLLQLLLQVWMYSVGIGLLSVALGVVPATELTTYYYVQLLFPVSMGHYWFMTAYVFLYLLLPFIGMASKRMTREQMRVALICLFFCFCILKSVLPIRLDMDQKGYDCLWYLCVFLAAAYVRKFGVKLFEKKWLTALIYPVAACLIFLGTMALHTVYVRTGSLGLLIGVCQEYNHVLPFIAAVGLFAAFLQLRISEDHIIGKIICKVAPCTLGVYLLHENLGLRYAWQPLLGSEKVNSVGGLILSVCIAVFVVFFAGILLEAARKALLRQIYKLLSLVGPVKSLLNRIENLDGLFKE